MKMLETLLVSASR